VNVTLLLAAACVATDPTSDDAVDTGTPPTDGLPPPTYTIEYDSQGVACVAGETGDGFAADEPLHVTVDFGCVDGCRVQSSETRCTASTLPGLLVVSSHGHVVYYEDTTTTCTATCMPLVASCSYDVGLTDGQWGLSYSATLTWFDVPTTDAVCAADTSDT
jgi:hypothetical protein